LGEFEGIDPEDLEQLRAYINDLFVETPRTRTATVRISKALSKNSGRMAGAALKDTLIQFGAATTAKLLSGGTAY
jgi:hypothetical protein